MVSVSCFGVRVSVMFHFMFVIRLVQFGLLKIGIENWKIAARLVSTLFSLYFVYL